MDDAFIKLSDTVVLRKDDIDIFDYWTAHSQYSIWLHGAKLNEFLDELSGATLFDWVKQQGNYIVFPNKHRTTYYNIDKITGITKRIEVPLARHEVDDKEYTIPELSFKGGLKLTITDDERDFILEQLEKRK